MKYEDLVSAHDRPARPERHRSTYRRAALQSRFRLSRRRFLGAAWAGATGFALVAVGWLPPYRGAQAAHLQSPGYEIPTPPPNCVGENYTATCSSPCDVAPECADCCVTSGHKKGFHSDVGIYSLRPNECYDGTSDGWKWDFDGCCVGCKDPRFRCHDGKKNGNATVCLWTLKCNCEAPCTPC